MAYKQPYHQSYPGYSDGNNGFYEMENDSIPMQPNLDPWGTDKARQDMAPSPRPGNQWNPMNWSKRNKIIAAVATGIILIIIIVVAAVEGSKASAYPDYKALSYHLDTTFQPDNFFNDFTYWTTYDPADGFVHYDNPIDAKNRNLTFMSNSAAYLRVDNKETDQTTGRHSVRVSSNKQWNSGLFLFDIQHAPYGCATWPAVWLSDQYNWPNNGEIDIIEAVNQATTGVQSTLHTTKGCTMSVKRKETGSVAGTNCWNGTDSNAGCGVIGPDATYGEAFNNAGGGVYATEWRNEGIRIWFFPRANLPSDVSAAIGSQASTAAPDPSKWPEALADFPSTDCDISSHFRNASIIANIDLCGQWAGRVYQQDGCPGDCKTYVAQNASAFDNAFWQFGQFSVFQAAGEP